MDPFNGKYGWNIPWMVFLVTYFNIGLYGKMNKSFFLDQCQWCNLVVRNHPPEPFNHPGL